MTVRGCWKLQLSPHAVLDAFSVPGVFLALRGAFFSACYLIPWKLASQHGDPKHATLVLLTAAALFNTFALAPVRRDDVRPLALAPTLKLAAVLAVLSLAGIWFSAESVHRVSGALLAVFMNLGRRAPRTSS